MSVQARDPFACASVPELIEMLEGVEGQPDPERSCSFASEFRRGVRFGQEQERKLVLTYLYEIEQA